MWRLLLFLLVSFTSVANAGLRCQSIHQSPRNSRHESFSYDDTGIWAILRAANLLVDQHSIPGRESLCGPTCVVNAVQAATMKAGRVPMAKPQEVLEQLVRNHESNGGIPVVEASKLLSALLKEQIKDIPSRVRVDIVGETESSPGINSVRTLQVKDLTPKINEVKILLTAQLSHTGEIMVLHAQVLEAIDGYKMKVVEPSRPSMEISVAAKGNAKVNGTLVPRFKYELIEKPRLGEVELEGFVVWGAITVELGE